MKPHLYNRCARFYQMQRASRKVKKIGVNEWGTKIEDVMSCDLAGGATMVRMPHVSGLPNFEITFDADPTQVLQVRRFNVWQNGAELRGAAKQAVVAKIDELLKLNGC